MCVCVCLYVCHTYRKARTRQKSGINDENGQTVLMQMQAYLHMHMYVRIGVLYLPSDDSVFIAVQCFEPFHHFRPGKEKNLDQSYVM